MSLCSPLYTCFKATDYSGFGFCSKYGTWKRCGFCEKGKEAKQKDGRQERGGGGVDLHTRNLERARPWTHPRPLPKHETEILPKVPGRAFAMLRLACAPSVPQPPRHTGLSVLGPQPCKLLGTLSSLRRPQPAVDHWAPARQSITHSWANPSAFLHPPSALPPS